MAFSEGKRQFLYLIILYSKHCIWYSNYSIDYIPTLRKMMCILLGIANFALQQFFD